MHQELSKATGTVGQLQDKHSEVQEDQTQQRTGRLAETEQQLQEAPGTFLSAVVMLFLPPALHRCAPRAGSCHSGASDSVVPVPVVPP